MAKGCQAVGQVPSSLIGWAAGVIGIPCAVVAAQINEESGGNPNAVSPAGAQGVAQFIPSTWRGEGCGGSPFNVNDAMKCYAKYMYELVRQEHGNVRDALAAYNAGPGNLQAGYGYADAILAAAGQPSGLAASGGSGASGAGGTAQATLDAASSAACLIGNFKVGFGPVGYTMPCLFRKSNARALIGGLILLTSASVALVGAVILAASAFQRTGALAKAADAAAVVPGATPVAAGLSRAHTRATRTGSQAAAQRSRP